MDPGHRGRAGARQGDPGRSRPAKVVPGPAGYGLCRVLSPPKSGVPGAPAAALTPANMGNLWAPFATVLAAYGPFFYGRDRRIAFLAVALLTVIVARPWQPSAVVITIAVLRTVVGPLLALYFGARYALLR